MTKDPSMQRIKRPNSATKKLMRFSAKPLSRIAAAMESKNNVENTKTRNINIIFSKIDEECIN